MDFEKYIRRANDEIAVVVQIEHRDAVTNIEDILKVEGIDGVFIGPYDLTGSIGFPGELESPQVQKSIIRVLDTCKKYRKSAGIHIVKPSKEALKEALSRGFTFIALSIDTLLIDSACRELLNINQNSR